MPKVIRQSYIKEKSPRKIKIYGDNKVCCANCESENFCKVNINSHKGDREIDNRDKERRRCDCGGFELRKIMKSEV